MSKKQGLDTSLFQRQYQPRTKHESYESTKNALALLQRIKVLVECVCDGKNEPEFKESQSARFKIVVSESFLIIILPLRLLASQKFKEKSRKDGNLSWYFSKSRLHQVINQRQAQNVFTSFCKMKANFEFSKCSRLSFLTCNDTYS